MTANYLRFLSGLGTILIVGLICWAVLIKTSYHQPAPDVVFKTIDGAQIPLNQQRGKPVLVNFWASTCGYCLQEMPHLANLYRELSPSGFLMIGVAMPYDMPSRVVQVARQMQLPYPIAIDPQHIITKAFGNVRMTPTSFLINSQGIIISKTTGTMNLDDLRKQIKQQLTKEQES